MDEDKKLYNSVVNELNKMEKNRLNSYEKLYNILHNKFISQQQTIDEINIEIKNINQKFCDNQNLNNMYWKMLGHPIYGKLIPISFPEGINRDKYYYTVNGIIYYENNRTIPIDPYVMYFTYFYDKRENDKKKQYETEAQKEAMNEQLKSETLMKREQDEMKKRIELLEDEKKLKEEELIRNQIKQEQTDKEALISQIREEQKVNSVLNKAGQMKEVEQQPIQSQHNQFNHNNKLNNKFNHNTKFNTTNSITTTIEQQPIQSQQPVQPQQPTQSQQSESKDEQPGDKELVKKNEFIIRRIKNQLLNKN